ncbi:MFS multidrug transporter-like protein [Ophiobolus disseminans]|uniref:MFS multidrug transporter-like protein n=1 Tax=Ophiobolus disseminans TaxID=1469910 RepID=A0A6A6ZLQ4_9PLEO|nr:MFS multidrug transporter-like protein [Ophiobolus disseminans]
MSNKTDQSRVQNSNEVAPSDNGVQYLHGLRFYLFITAITVALFLANLEIPIVTTSLVVITNDFHGFERGSWIISAYLLGFVAMVIIISKLSDIFGQKPMFLAAITTFMIFSGACGAAQSLTQMIIFRAFQGLGGRACFAMCSVISMDINNTLQLNCILTPQQMVYAISLMVGPILGGIISRTYWRWIFLLNLPTALPALLIVFWCVPRGFPYHGRPKRFKQLSHLMSRATVKRVDFLGSALLLLATLSLVPAVEEAGLSHGWRSAFTMTLLVTSEILWILFFLWERQVTRNKDMAGVTEPVFPWRFVQNRVFVGMLFNRIFLGSCWFCTIFQLPLRYQVVHGTSALGAGLRTMPFIASALFSSAITAALAKKGNPPLYLVIGSGILQVCGFSLLANIPPSTVITARQYSYEALAGFGCGSSISLLVLLVPFSVLPRDTSVAMGAVMQFRLMGGAVTLSIINTARAAYLRSTLNDLLTAHQITQILEFAPSVNAFDPATKHVVGIKLADAYNLQTKILAGVAGAQVLSSLLMWQKNQITV